ncbi:hypothetical protein QWU92_06420, partial [Neisseria gonorrhoeae]
AKTTSTASDIKHIKTKGKIKMAEEMRTCKACGGTKPLEKGFNAVPRKEGGVYYYKSCKTCRNKAVRQKRAEKRAAAGAGAMTAARLHGYIRAAHAACPILGAGLWTQPAGECA